jgi:hypothetical protein
MPLTRIWLAINVLPVAIFGCFEALLAWPQFFYQLSGAIVALAIVAVYLLAARNQVEANWWQFLLLPLTTLVSVLAYSVLISQAGLIHLLYILSSFFVLIYLRTVYYFLHQPGRYKLRSIENSASYLNFYNFFLLSSSLYGFQSYLSLKDYQFVLLVFLYTCVVFYQLMWVMKLSLLDSAKHISVAAIVISEIALALSFLPFDYNVSGLVLALCYYLISSLYRSEISETLTREKVKYYAGFAIIVFLLIFITVRWL